MPVQYSGILAEVKAVRTAVGIFDVSHMGRVYIEGRSPPLFWMGSHRVGVRAAGGDGPDTASSATRKAGN